MPEVKSIESAALLSNKGLRLPVMETFYSIQGEGAYSGHVAYFIRLGGCDVGCHWCDVKESWDVNKHPLTHINELVREVVKQKAKIVIITGGEPLIWPLDALTQSLKEKGFRTHIETSGVYQLSGKWDWICLSPKKNKKPLIEVLKKANELKAVIYNHNDFLFAQEQAQKVSENCLLYLQPEWSKRLVMMPKIVDFVLQNPKWRVSLQTHKYLEIR